MKSKTPIKNHLFVTTLLLFIATGLGYFFQGEIQADIEWQAFHSQLSVGSKGQGSTIYYMPTKMSEDILAETVEEELEVRKKKFGINFIDSYYKAAFSMRHSFVSHEIKISQSPPPFYVLYHQWKVDVNAQACA